MSHRNEYIKYIFDNFSHSMIFEKETFVEGHFPIYIPTGSIPFNISYRIEDNVIILMFELNGYESEFEVDFDTDQSPDSINYTLVSKLNEKIDTIIPESVIKEWTDRFNQDK